MWESHLNFKVLVSLKENEWIKSKKNEKFIGTCVSTH
jgi:hypothetical protein